MRRKNENGLFAQEQVFADLILVGKNQTQSYKDAGFTAKNDNVAAASASKLLSRSKVAAFIEKRKQKLASKLQIKQEHVLAQIRNIGFVDPAKFFDENKELLHVTAMPSEVRVAISSFEVEKLFEGRGENREQIGYVTKFKLWPKLDALVKLGEYLGTFKGEAAPVSGFHVTIEVIGGTPKRKRLESSL